MGKMVNQNITDCGIGIEVERSEDNKNKFHIFI